MLSFNYSYLVNPCEKKGHRDGEACGGAGRLKSTRMRDRGGMGGILRLFVAPYM